MYAASLPMDAGGAAVLVVPNQRSTRFAVEWHAPDGTLVPHDVSGGEGHFHLHPRVALSSGTHDLHYTDDCGVGDSGVDFRLQFENAEPPPDRIGELTVDYQKHCANEGGNGKFLPYFPPPLTISLELDPALLPHAARLQVNVKDDTGTFDHTYWAVESPHFVSTPTPNCGSGGGIEPGERTFVASARLVGGQPLAPATAKLSLECPRCNEFGKTIVEGGAGPPPMPVADASPRASEGAAAPPGDRGCSVGPGHSDARPWEFLALGIGAAALVRARRSRPSQR